MDFNLHNISVSNLFLYDFDPIVFSVMGMLIVFSGLALISLYIVMLPRLLSLFEKKKQPESSGEVQQAASEDEEILMAIAVALHLDQTNDAGEMKITWPRHQDASPWQHAGRIRGLAVRSHLSRR